MTKGQKIDSLVIPEANFGPTYPVTPFIARDNGEVSGPSMNWRHVPLTVGHLLLAIQSLSSRDRKSLKKEIEAMSTRKRS